MTDSKMDEVKDDRKLKGKTNFISWKREFERAAKANDILEYLTGEEVVPSKPKKEDYFVKPIEVDTRRPIPAKKKAQNVTPSTDDDDETNDVQTMTSTNNSLRWQMDSDEHKAAKAKMKLAGKLLDAWVSDGIKIEIEEFADGKEAYDFIKKRYAVTNERARDNLLNQLNELKLEDCSSMTEYTNRVRQVKADLKTVKYDMTDDMLATALLHGLPPNFRDFKEKYDWIRSTKPDDAPDLDYLYERLYVEEVKQIRLKEERKARERVRKETSSNNNNPSGSTGYNGSGQELAAMPISSGTLKYNRAGVHSHKCQEMDSA
jgi:gag-polypeptide of LTR copia-type